MKPDITKCAAVIIREGKYLILKDDKDSFWKNVGGKIERDESPEECLKREVQEELGVKVIGEPEYYFSTPITETESGPKRTLVIHLYKAEIGKEPTAAIGSEIHWLSKVEFENGEIVLASQIEDYILPRLIEDKLVY